MFLYKSYLRISIAGKHKLTIRIKPFKGTIANRAVPSLYGGSLAITLQVPLNYFPCRQNPSQISLKPGIFLIEKNALDANIACKGIKQGDLKPAFLQQTFVNLLTNLMEWSKFLLSN